MKGELLGCLNFSVKPLSGRYSWTTYDNRKQADRDAQSSVSARLHGRHTRRLYRVNIYENTTSILAGPMGRIIP